ncbi:MAG: helix-turn-helix domain-containing protein [Haloarculaceae archaeon]
MSVIAEFEFRSSGMVLESTFQTVPEVELEVIHEVAMDPEMPNMFFWASGADLDAFERAMTDDETISEFERYSQKNDEVLYRLQVSDRTEIVVYPAWVERGAELLDERWRDGWWHARMRFPDHESLQTFQTWCADTDVEFALQAVYRGPDDDRDLLTDEQHETLTLALASGFFEVPKETTMDELAAELDVSAQAVSERLRRAEKKLARRYVEP